MKLKELKNILDDQFHKEYSLSWDNSGLLIGDLKREIKNILVSLDVTANVIKEAIDSNTDLIFSHHPLIFSPISNIVSNNYQGQSVLSLIEHKIALYCPHTNYDVMQNGLNDYVAELLELENIRSIIPNSTKWFKFVTFVPYDYEEKIRNSMCLAGGGQWKDYSCCTFKTEGEGTFKPGEDSNPFIGEKGSLSFVKEVKLECIVPLKKLAGLISSVIKNHPYEEPAYDVYQLENKFEEGGTGRIGNLKSALFLNNFLSFVKEKLNLEGFRYISKNNFLNAEKKIKTIAVVNGSANSIIEELINVDFDALVCGEISYHNVQVLAESDKAVAEIGHGESESFAVAHLSGILNDVSNKMRLGLRILQSNNKESLWRYSIERQ